MIEYVIGILVILVMGLLLWFIWIQPRIEEIQNCINLYPETEYNITQWTYYNHCMEYPEAHTP